MSKDEADRKLQQLLEIAEDLKADAGMTAAQIIEEIELRLGLDG